MRAAQEEVRQQRQMRQSGQSGSSIGLGPIERTQLKASDGLGQLTELQIQPLPLEVADQMEFVQWRKGRDVYRVGRSRRRPVLEVDGRQGRLEEESLEGSNRRRRRPPLQLDDRELRRASEQASDQGRCEGRLLSDGNRKLSTVSKYKYSKLLSYFETKYLVSYLLSNIIWKAKYTYLYLGNFIEYN